MSTTNDIGPYGTKQCVYDNPENWNRERWVDGRLVERATREMVEHIMDRERYPITILNWESGRIIGDPDAMKTTIQKVAHRGDK